MMTSTSWLAVPLNQQARLRLFCFPYAGGGAQIYHRWHEAFPAASGVKVCPVQLPGRGSRLHEKPFNQCAPLVEAAASALLPYFDRPFVFFGHSMGALISFELARLLRRKRGPQPLHLFLSGRPAPQTKMSEPLTYNLPEAEFIEQLRRLNGTPQEVFNHPELLQLMLPTIRADFTLSQTYTYLAEPPLRCPISAFGGLQDEDVSREQLDAWREQTISNFSFLHSAEKQLLQTLAHELSYHRF
jgi:medium-chain acyl-[acyl-carrier-protein] hydrolase